jgi:glycopeptide antibiotics resistance protein
MMVYFTVVHLLIGLVALFVVLIVLWKQKKSFSYLFFFSVFWIYMLGVVSVVVFPFPIGVANPNFKPSVNLMPFNFGSCFVYMPEVCLRNIYENILLTIPFGFGISFIARLKPQNILRLALAVGLIFEITQLVISLIFKSAFRSVDINDVILNAVGVFLGYGIFRLFGWLYVFVTDRFEIQHRNLFAYIDAVVR